MVWDFLLMVWHLLLLPTRCTSRNLGLGGDLLSAGGIWNLVPGGGWSEREEDRWWAWMSRSGETYAPTSGYLGA